MQSNIDSALQDYADFLKAEFSSRGASWAKSGFDRQLVVEFDKGSKFIKVIVGYSTDGVRDPSRSSHSFIVLKSDKFQFGDILKSASWRAPAKNFARGNVLEKSYGSISWCGA
jgi:uncharacterized Fe-S cluster-containing protein